MNSLEELFKWREKSTVKRLEGLANVLSSVVEEIDELLNSKNVSEVDLARRLVDIGCTVVVRLLRSWRDEYAENEQ